jgi:GAF domain-containing protein
MTSYQPFLLKDSERESGCPTETFPFGSHLCVPIGGSVNESFGVLFAGSPLTNAFDHEEIQFLQFIGKSLGLAIQRLKRMDQLGKAIEMDSCAMAAFVGSMRTREATFDSILDGILRIVPAMQASLFLWSSSESLLKPKQVRGPHAVEEWNTSFQMGQGIPGRVLESGQSYWTMDVQQDPFYRSKFVTLKSLLCLPLLSIKGEPLGVINVSQYESAKPFTSEEIETACTFASRAAVAIENILRHEKDRMDRNIPEENPQEKKAA